MLVGLLAVATVPAVVAVAEGWGMFELLQGAGAVPFAAVAGALAVWLARRARRRTERTLGRVGGTTTAATGRVLGITGLLLATAGAVALATYYGLSRFAE